MKIGILISGRGSNMTAIADAVAKGEIPDSEVVCVISDKAEAGGVEKARERGLAVRVIERNGRKRRDHDAEIVATLREHSAELICLAGYMRLLSPEFISAFPNSIVNIHPSLLPSFPGLDAQRQAFDYGTKITGCTVHFVDEELDHGAIILQKEVFVHDDDTADSLAARILAEEHPLYIAALRKLATSEFEFDGRKVIFRKAL